MQAVVCKVSKRKEMMAVVVSGGSADKAQTIQVGPEACSTTGWTPTSVAEQIANDLQKSAAHLVAAPIAKHEGLRGLRERARQMRATLVRQPHVSD